MSLQKIDEIIADKLPENDGEKQSVKESFAEKSSDIDSDNQSVVTTLLEASNKIREEAKNAGENKVGDDEKSKVETIDTIKTNSQISIKSGRKFSPQTALRQMFGVIVSLKNGWKLYISQPIVLACFGFSFLYLTILGLSYITLAYIYSQCLSEFSVGLMSAGAGLTGIIATFLYPSMRKSFGLIKTGVINAIFQLVTLVPCIVSVFVAGSPFYLLPQNFVNETATAISTTFSLNNSMLEGTTSSLNLSMLSTTSSLNNSMLGSTATSPISLTSSSGSQLFLKCLHGVKPPVSYLSLVLLLSGIILARIGLWGFDLTITQLIQESVAETERGVFNGVQSSLNNLMDLLIYVLVLVFPLPNQFGILVLISAAFITTGYLLFFVYAIKSHRQSVARR